MRRNAIDCGQISGAEIFPEGSFKNIVDQVRS